MGRGNNNIAAVAVQHARAKVQSTFDLAKLNFLHAIELDYDTEDRGNYDYYSSEPDDYYYENNHYQEISNARVSDEYTEEDFKRSLRSAISQAANVSELERFALDQFVTHTPLELSADSFTAVVSPDYYGDTVESVTLEDEIVTGQVNEFLKKFTALKTIHQQAECLLKLAHRGRVPRELENRNWTIEALSLSSLDKDNELVELPDFSPRFINKAVYGLGKRQGSHVTLISNSHQVPQALVRPKRTIHLLVAE